MEKSNASEWIARGYLTDSFLYKYILVHKYEKGLSEDNPFIVFTTSLVEVLKKN